MRGAIHAGWEARVYLVGLSPIATHGLLCSSFLVFFSRGTKHEETRCEEGCPH